MRSKHRPENKAGGKSAKAASASSSLVSARAQTRAANAAAVADAEDDDQSSDPGGRGKAASRTTDQNLDWNPDQISGQTSGRTTVQTFDPGLYIVATPIGNARDITLRALDLLARADIIACEDTRVSRKLLHLHGIDRPTLAYHDHNAARVRPGLMERLNKGEIVALISDAGTPLISDPGYRLVNEARAAGHGVTALPGASAPMAALASAGLPTDRFLFAGFPPAKSAARRRMFAEFTDLAATLVFFEGAPRLAASLSDMAEVLGPRQGAVLRELTKKFEEARHGELGELAAHYIAAGPPKGEIVVLVAPRGDEAVTLNQDEIDGLLLAAMEQASVKDAATALAQRTGLPRRELYNRALKLRENLRGETGGQ